MRSRCVVLVGMLAVLAGAVAASAPGRAGAVGGTFTASCVTTGGIHGPVTVTKTFGYDVSAPDTVAPGGGASVTVRVGYAVPTTAQIGVARFEVVGGTTPQNVISAAPGATEITGAIAVQATGAVGTTLDVSLSEFGAAAVISGHLISEVCTPLAPLVLARIPIGVPSVSIGDAAVVEGSSGTRALEFAVSLSRPAATDVTVTFGTESGTATAGSDFTTLSGSVTIHAGFVSGIARVRVRGDSTVEPTENFRVRLVGPSGAALARAVGTGRIIDDDPEPGLRISIGDGSVVEGARGTRSARFVVSLSEAASEDITFHYATVDGSALAGVDYRAQDSTYQIPAGSTSISVPVPVLADGTPEPIKTFGVRLAAATGATIGRANGVGRIIDDD
jgi:hypothetical protein